MDPIRVAKAVSEDIALELLHGLMRKLDCSPDYRVEPKASSIAARTALPYMLLARLPFGGLWLSLFILAQTLATALLPQRLLLPLEHLAKFSFGRIAAVLPSRWTEPHKRTPEPPPEATFDATPEQLNDIIVKNFGVHPASIAVWAEEVNGRAPTRLQAQKHEVHGVSAISSLLPEGTSRIAVRARTAARCLHDSLARIVRRHPQLRTDEKLPMEACIYSAYHTRFGVRPRGSHAQSPWVFFDLRTGPTLELSQPGAHAFSPRYESLTARRSSEVVRLSLEDVEREAVALIEEHGEYFALSNNCQAYAARLAARLGFVDVARNKWLPSRRFWSP